jgi:3-phosphoshikimate 1-carboxyvinyltransferase
VQADGLVIEGGAGRRLGSARIDAHGDHRIAMAFAVAGLSGAAGTVRIDDPGCAAVSYPGFWSDLAALGSHAR